MLFAPNELVARTMLVPPSKIGTPESPKQVPPLECSLMNSSLIELLLATRVVAAKNRVVVFHIKWHLSFEFFSQPSRSNEDLRQHSYLRRRISGLPRGRTTVRS